MKTYAFAQDDTLRAPKQDFELITDAYEKVVTLARRTIEIRKTRQGIPTPCDKCYRCPLKTTCLAYKIADARKRAKKAVAE